MEVDPREHHIAVKFGESICVMGGIGRWGLLSLRKIWMYNLNTSAWRKYAIPSGLNREAPSKRVYAGAAVIGDSIYVFGGAESYHKFNNDVWKFNRTRNRFRWVEIPAKGKEKSPSPRYGHSMWEYAGKVWTYGGDGLSPDGYLHDHGEFGHACIIPEGRHDCLSPSPGVDPRRYRTIVSNNQLLCFDPSTAEWSNPACSGRAPAVSRRHLFASHREKAWVHEGDHIDLDGSLRELCLESLTWTRIQLPVQGLDGISYKWGSFVALSERQLIMRGGYGKYNREESECPTWLVDLDTLSWRKCPSARQRAPRSSDPPPISNSREVIAVGGCHLMDYDSGEKFVQRVRIQPPSLQEMCMAITYKHKDELPLEELPKHLKNRLTIPQNRNR